MIGATLNRRAWQALSHLPDAGGGLFWADLQILRQPLAFTRAVHARCGTVARTVIGGQPHVLLLSAEALETVLLDRERVFSAQGGWTSLMGELFRRGLLLRDGEEHRHHRRLMLPAMRREALEGYLERMALPLAHTVRAWVSQGALPDAALPAMRRMALSRAADLLLALSDAEEVASAERNFAELVDASTALVRLPLLGRKYARGLKARDRLSAQLLALTRQRRMNPGPDMLSRLCLAQDEEGHHLQDDEIVDHLVFLMMAAHDTTASALCSALVMLAEHPDWQERLRQEVHEEDGQQPLMQRLAARREMGLVIREVLRLNPPVALLQRQALRDTVVDGHRLPAGALLSLVPLHVQRDARWWPDPDRFVPSRHEPLAHAVPPQLQHQPAQACPHPYAWTPFGGGAHLCLGLHLADAQMRLVLGELLLQARWSLPAGTQPRWRHAPITHPAASFPIELQALA